MKFVLFCHHISFQRRLEKMTGNLFPNQSDVPFDQYQLNVELSNRLALFRGIPDARPAECLTKRCVHHTSVFNQLHENIKEGNINQQWFLVQIEIQRNFKSKLRSTAQK